MLMPKKYDPLKGFQLPQVSYGGPPMPNPYQQIAQGQAQMLGGPQVAVPPMQGAPVMPPQYEGPMATDLGPLKQKYEQDMSNWDAATRAQYNQPEMPMPDRGRIQPLEGALVALGSALAGQMTKQDPSQNFYTALRTRQAGLDQEFQDKWLKAKEKHAAQSARLQGEAMIAERHLKESGADLNQHENQNAALETMKTRLIENAQQKELDRKNKLAVADARLKGAQAMSPTFQAGIVQQNYEEGLYGDPASPVAQSEYRRRMNVLGKDPLKSENTARDIQSKDDKHKMFNATFDDVVKTVQERYKVAKGQAEMIGLKIRDYDEDRAYRIADVLARQELARQRFDLSRTTKDATISKQVEKEYADSFKTSKEAIENEIEIRKYQLSQEPNPLKIKPEDYESVDPQLKKLRDEYIDLMKREADYKRTKTGPKTTIRPTRGRPASLPGYVPVDPTGPGFERTKIKAQANPYEDLLKNL